MFRTFTVSLLFAIGAGIAAHAQTPESETLSTTLQQLKAEAELSALSDPSASDSLATLKAQARTLAASPEVNIDVLKLEAQLGAMTTKTLFMQDSSRDAERALRDRVREASRQHDDAYHAGTNYLDRHAYEKAIEQFNHVIEDRAARTDGALYWRAYAENKLGHRDDALATLGKLQKEFASSPWLNDAKALQVEVRQASGQRVSPEAEGDEELKLLALNGLMNSDPDRTLPLVQKLLVSDNSPKVKERALFVLAQSDSPKARAALAQVAKGGTNPDLQLKAVEYLGVFRGNENQQLLSDLYRNTNDPAIKRAVLQSFMISGNATNILEVARSDKDPEFRKEAVRMCIPAGREKTGSALPGLYANESDPGVRREILGAMFAQGNATGLVELARKESRPAVKKEIVGMLANMHSKEATDYMLEILNK